MGRSHQGRVKSRRKTYELNKTIKNEILKPARLYEFYVFLISLTVVQEI